MDNILYHSALYKYKKFTPETLIEKDGSVAFQHDIFEGLHTHYSRCDILYIEPPWQAGFDMFENRVKKKSEYRTYHRLMQQIALIASSVKIPIVIVTGKHAHKYFYNPTSTFPTTYIPHNNECMICTYRIAIPTAHASSTTNIIKYLSGQYNCVGDFMCGYGKTAYMFYKQGKQFVASDYNAECIGYFKEWWK